MRAGSPAPGRRPRAESGNAAAARPPPGGEILPSRPERPAGSGQEPVLFAYPRRGARRDTAARLRRLAVALAAVTCGALGWAGAVPAASAAAGGMPGWQITLIAVAAALAAAATAVVLDRARARRCARCKPHIHVLPCIHYPNRAIVKSSFSILSKVRRTPDAGGPLRSGVSAALGTDLPVRRVPASAGDRLSGRAHGDPKAQRIAARGRGTLTGAAMWRP